MSASIELRRPFTSVLNGSKLGAVAFLDAGKTWDAGGRMRDAEWRRGAGAGLFLIASVVRLNLDVARGLRTGDTRVHLSSGFSF
jgi:outer membrane translocation and assembly module TamA